MTKYPWFALSVRTHQEKAVAQRLRQKGLEEFLPFYGAGSHDSDLPMFPGYVFCRFGRHGRPLVFTTPGITSTAGSGPVAACAYTRVGDRVELVRGPLKGVHGIVIRQAGATHLVVGIDMLQRSLSVEIENTWAVPS